MPHPDLNRGQGNLFCRCGATLGCRARVCRRCRQSEADSLRRFGGCREAVLVRDRGLCVACGEQPRRPHVHHRRPGVQDRRWMATVCPRCHARIHKLATMPARWLEPRLIELWVEQHPGAPLQLQLELSA